VYSTTNYYFNTNESVTIQVATDYAGTLTKQRLDYSTDGGNSWVLALERTPSDQVAGENYAWRTSYTKPTGFSTPGIVIFRARAEAGNLQSPIHFYMPVRILDQTCATILTHPSSVTVGARSRAEFQFVGEGDGGGDIFYQWRKDSVDIPGKTGTAPSRVAVPYVIPVADLPDAGAYSVAIRSGFAGTWVTSQIAQLTVIAIPPTIDVQPAPATVIAGATASFGVVAGGVGPFTYQWFKNGVAVPSDSAALPVFTIANAQSGDSGNYTVVVQNSSGTVTSTVASLVVNPAVPAITSSPSAAGTVGTGFSYAITASNGPITSFGAINLPTDLSLNTGTGIITGVPTAVGTHSILLTATNAGGTSPPALLVLTVVANAGLPVVTSSLRTTGTVSTGFAYTITATNSPTSFGATGLPAGLDLTSSTGVISGTSTAIGTYSVTLTATNAAGTSLPAALILTVVANAAVPVVTSSLSAVGTVGTAFTYTITATNSPTSFSAVGLPHPLTLDSSSGVISGTPTAAAPFSVALAATNAAGPSPTATLELAINPAATPPVIGTAPIARTVVVGQTVTFSVTASGTAPLTYQWRCGGVACVNGGNVSGATAASLTLTNVQTSNAGSYDVIVSNSAASVTSAVATLTVNQADAENQNHLNIHTPYSP
jgi:hypothetical protein